MTLLAALFLGLTACAGGAHQVAGVDDTAPPSEWYLDRGTHRREPWPEDALPAVADRLAAIMRDDRVPGFYDGQFADTADDFEGLAQLAHDESIHASLRMMAIMALQEAGDGAELAAVLEPLIIAPEEEFRAEQDEWDDFGTTTEEGFVRRILEADLSRHARFALAKDGQPRWVLEKIEVMKRRVMKRKYLVLDPAVKSSTDLKAAWLRSVWFDIAYHFQQYDDYENAAHWFRQLCDHLDGDDTRWAHYNLACIAALEGRPEQSVAELAAAAEAGFLDVAWMQEDGDLSSLRGRPDFDQLVRDLGGTPNSNSQDGESDPESSPTSP
jgi:hypothetical protein